VSPVKYEPGFYIPEDGILHSHRREHLKSQSYLLILYLELLMIIVYNPRAVALCSFG
jgi:hypothetical protein